MSRDVIVEAAIEILDTDGEAALTFRALTAHLSTGYGAVYHHVANKDDLLAAACDHVVAAAMEGLVADVEPPAALRALAIGLFDTIDAHPWVGAELTKAPWRPVVLGIYEKLGSLLRACGVADEAVFDCAGVLVNYVFGVAGQSAAHARARADGTTSLADVAAQWARLDPAEHPALHGASGRLREHDDREQFLAGVELILAGVEALHVVGDQPAPAQKAEHTVAPDRPSGPATS